jgi:hypothetical protein
MGIVLVRSFLKKNDLNDSILIGEEISKTFTDTTLCKTKASQSKKFEADRTGG